MGLLDQICCELPREIELPAQMVEALRRQVRLELQDATSPWRIEGSTPARPAAAVVLARHWPTAVTFDELHAQSRALLVGPDPSTENERGLLASDLPDTVPLVRKRLAGVAERNRGGKRLGFAVRESDGAGA